MTISKTEPAIPPGMTPNILPGILREIAEIAGMTAAIKICYAKRGSRLYIPVIDGLSSSRQFVQIVGMEDACKISKALGGETFSIPTARPVLRAYYARALRTAGYSGLQIAMILDMDRKHVSRLASLEEYPKGDVDPKLLKFIFENAPARFSRMKPASDHPHRLATDEED